jgi:hypothetical protein
MDFTLELVALRYFFAEVLEFYLTCLRFPPFYCLKLALNKDLSPEGAKIP